MNNISSKKNLIIILAIIAVALAAGIILFLNHSSDNKDGSEETTISSEKGNNKYKVMINGKEYTFPAKINDILKTGFYYKVRDTKKDALNPYKLEMFAQGISPNPPEIQPFDKSYIEIPDAGFGVSYVTDVDLFLVHKAGTDMKDENNYTVTGFSATNVSKEYFNINGLGSGSTIREFIEKMNIDINKENCQKSFHPRNRELLSYLSYYDEKSNTKLELIAGVTSDDDKVLTVNYYLDDTSKFA